MPLAQIFLRQGTTPEYRKSISDSVRQAMKDVLELPEDDYFHVIHGKEPENMIQAPVFWGVERSAGSVFIQMSFNPRPPAQKEALFASVAERLVESPGVRREDIFMMILETAAENWWAHAREVDAETGFDARM